MLGSWLSASEEDPEDEGWLGGHWSHSDSEGRGCFERADIANYYIGPFRGAVVLGLY